MQRVSNRPTNLKEFNQQFPPPAGGHRPGAKDAACAECSPPRERLLAQAVSIKDLQDTLSSLSVKALGEDSQLLLALARHLPLTLRNEPGLMKMCASSCLQAAGHAPLATQEDVWTILRNVLPSLPRQTAIALRDSLDAFRHYQPAAVV